LQPDGKVVATGIFAPTNGTPSGSIARFNADGSWDTSFQAYLWPFVQPGDCVPSYGCWQWVEATSVLVQPDGKVLIGGHVWTTVYGDEWSYDILRPFLGRFEINGSRDWSFVSGTNYSESCLARQSDGKILVGGTEGISRLNTNGTLDLGFNAGAAYGIRSVALQSDGKVLVGGGFGTVQGTNRNGIARLHANGILDGSFNPGSGGSGTVYAVALQTDGKVLVGKDHTYDGTNYNSIKRLNSNGSPDTSFNPGSGASGAVRVITVQPDGNVLIGGNFTTVKGVVRPNVARLYGDSLAPSPSLSIVRSNTAVIISWPVTTLNFQLQETTNIAPPISWSLVQQPVVTNAGQVSVNLPIAVRGKLYRLKSP